MKRFSSGNIIENIAIYGGTLAFGIGAVWGQGVIADAMYGATRAEEFVEQQGYTDVQIDDKDMVLVGLRGCGKSDAVQYKFEATAPNGQENVRIAVCKGLFKAATLRQG